MDMSPQFLSTYFNPAAPLPSSPVVARVRVNLTTRRPRTTVCGLGFTTAIRDTDIVVISPPPARIAL
jgi:hypothetical protein